MENTHYLNEKPKLIDIMYNIYVSICILIRCLPEYLHNTERKKKKRN